MAADEKKDLPKFASEPPPPGKADAHNAVTKVGSLPPGALAAMLDFVAQEEERATEQSRPIEPERAPPTPTPISELDRGARKDDEARAHAPMVKEASEPSTALRSSPPVVPMNDAPLAAPPARAFTPPRSRPRDVLILVVAIVLLAVLAAAAWWVARHAST
jgi:hypothetical protein